MIKSRHFRYSDNDDNNKEALSLIEKRCSDNHEELKRDYYELSAYVDRSLHELKASIQEVKLQLESLRF